MYSLRLFGTDARGRDEMVRSLAEASFRQTAALLAAVCQWRTGASISRSQLRTYLLRIALDPDGLTGTEEPIIESLAGPGRFQASVHMNVDGVGMPLRFIAQLVHRHPIDTSTDIRHEVEILSVSFGTNEHADECRLRASELVEATRYFSEDFPFPLAIFQRVDEVLRRF